MRVGRRGSNGSRQTRCERQARQCRSTQDVHHRSFEFQRTAALGGQHDGRVTTGDDEARPAIPPEREGSGPAIAGRGKLRSGRQLSSIFVRPLDVRAFLPDNPVQRYNFKRGYWEEMNNEGSFQ